MRIDELLGICDRMEALGRTHVHVPIEEFREMASRLKNVRVKDGKVKVIVKHSASKRIGAKAKAAREERAWRAKSK